VSQLHRLQRRRASAKREKYLAQVEAVLKAAAGKGGKGLEGANRPSILPPKPAEKADGNKGGGKKGKEAAAPKRRAQSAGSSRSDAVAGSGAPASMRELVNAHWRAKQESRAVHAHTAYATTGVPVPPSLAVEPPTIAAPTAPPPPPPLDVVGEAEVRGFPAPVLLTGLLPSEPSMVHLLGRVLGWRACPTSCRTPMGRHQLPQATSCPC
jgi:hypothetical protein